MKIIIYMFKAGSRIKNPVKHQQDGAFCEYSYRRKVVSYFYKKLHLRSLTKVLNTLLEYLKLNVI